MSDIVRPLGSLDEDKQSPSRLRETIISKPVIKKEGKSMKKAPLFAVLALLFGVGSGFALFKVYPLPVRSQTNTTQQSSTQGTSEQKVEVGQVYGEKDASAFKDEVEGVLLTGGVNGEGTHRIVREGGVSQTVYLTSSSVDLNLFVNHRVMIKGETFRAQYAGWLMDVGQVKVVELNAQVPAWVQKELEQAEKSKND